MKKPNLLILGFGKRPLVTVITHQRAMELTKV
jgi:hypothetical protein